MQKFSEVFVPDYQQAQRYHNELLNHAKQAREARLSSGSPNPRHGSFGRRLRLLFVNLSAHKRISVTSQTSNAHS